MSSQKFEIDFSNPQNKVQFIRAGAGAGKTTTLIATCIAFAKQFKDKHQRYPKIIITTFTKKATQEIKERLIIEALEFGDESLFQYFNKKSFVQIGTIHNILNLFLRQHAESVGLPTDLTIVNDYKIFFSLKKHIKNLFEKQTDYQILLDHYKFDFLVQLLIKAVNLKTEHPGLRPVSDKILFELAAQERQNTLEAIDQFLLHARSEKLQPHVDFLNSIKEAVTQQSYERLVQAYDLKPRKYTLKSAPEIPQSVDEKIGEIYKDICLTPLSFDNHLAVTVGVQKIFDKLLNEAADFLQKQRLQTGEIAISDLELLTAKIITENPQAMQEFAAQYDFIMVDEYQDTSPLQVKILNDLMANKFQFIVGDPQQSIYLFRGARAEVFAGKEQEVNRAGFSTIQRMQNFRSHARLMTFMNDFFQSYSAQFLPMQTKNEDFQPRSFADVHFITSENEFAAIVNQAIRLHQQGVPFSEITILFKKNSDILDFAKYANSYNLPVQVQISKGFEDKSEVGDLLSLLRFLINPYDNENLIRLLRSPWFAISDQEIINIRQDDTTPSLWLQLRKQNHPVAQVLKNIENCYLEKGVSEALFYFISQTVFLKSAAHFDPTSLREANIWKFMQTVLANEVRSDFNLSDFVNYELTQFSADLSSSDGEGVPLFATNRVSLMTVHGSKGLQFKHVIISGFNSAIRNSGTEIFTFDETSSQYGLKVSLPEYDKLCATTWADEVYAKFLQRAREESDRVLYVAMTRAIDSLTLVREKSKTTPKNSWLEKINWIPEQFSSDKYSVSFLECHDDPIALEPQQSMAMKAIKPLQLIKDYRQTAAVTSLLTQDLVYEKDATIETSVNALSEQTIAAYNKTQKGTDLHKYFEALKYNNPSELVHDLSDTDKKALEWLMNQKEIDLRELFDHGHVEWGFGLQVGQGDSARFIQGQIDAWGFINNDLYIVDYKTGSTKYLDKAFEQLQAYASCLKHMGFVRKEQAIRLAVIYPFHDKLEERIKIKDLQESDLHLEFSI